MTKIEQFHQTLMTGTQIQIEEMVSRLIADADRMRKALEELLEEAQMSKEGNRLIAPKTVRKWALIGLGEKPYG